ncbi:hypothetical protein vseg_008627 [Gypsophila vaccaria]
MKISINLAAVVFVFLVVSMVTDRVSGRLVNVGGRDMWKPNVNYTEWASHENFYVDDWIGFKFDKNQFDVVEVNETGYRDCNNNFMITNITRGAGRDVYQLKEARPYYFICTRGYCYGGMKLAINVTLPPTPPPPPQGNDSYNNNNISPIYLLLLVITLLITSIFSY